MSASSRSDPDTVHNLRVLCEQLFSRRLTAAEEQELSRFVQGGYLPPAQGVSAQAIAQASSVVNDSAARAQAAISAARQQAQASLEQAAQAREREEEAILKVVDAARTLSDLRPSALQPGQRPGGGPMVMSQIADRLANLVQREVAACFEQQFGPLRAQIEAVLHNLQPSAPAGAVSGAAAGSRTAGS